MNRTITTAVFTLLCLLSLAERTMAQVETFQLQNGLTVIVNPIPESNDIGMESFYDVGFVDEPEGMVQAAHLLEHLVCYAPGAGFAEKEAMDWMNQLGMANAETLPTFTHYDYGVPADQLEKIIEIEAARMSQTQFSKDLIRQEAARVYQETDMVENNPGTGMVKHAFMALSHAWNFSTDTALVRGGLEDFNQNRFVDFYRSRYVPANCTLVISGKTTVEEAKRLVEKHLGKLTAGSAALSPIDWSKVVANQKVRWDSKNRAVCVAWAPPKDKKDQLLLNALANVVSQKLMMAKPHSVQAHMTFASNSMWSIGDLPLFIYAMAKQESDLEQLQSSLEEWMVAEMKSAVKQGPSTAKMLARSFEFQLKPSSWARVNQTSKMLTNRGMDEKTSIQQIILQDALTRESPISSLATSLKRHLSCYELRLSKTSNPHSTTA